MNRNEQLQPIETIIFKMEGEKEQIDMFSNVLEKKYENIMQKYNVEHIKNEQHTAYELHIPLYSCLKEPEHAVAQLAQTLRRNSTDYKFDSFRYEIIPSTAVSKQQTESECDELLNVKITTNSFKEAEQIAGIGRNAIKMYEGKETIPSYHVQLCVPKHNGESIDQAYVQFAKKLFDIAPNSQMVAGRQLHQ